MESIRIQSEKAEHGEQTSFHFFTGEHRHHWNLQMSLLPNVIKRACMITLIGLTIGGVEFCVTTALAIFVSAKFEHVYKLIEEGNQYQVLFWTVPAMTITAAVVAYLCPVAAGSTLPEVKGYLNGANIPGIFSIFTTVVKALGVVVVISCGFPVGREGPMVQVGCAVAFQILKMPWWNSLLRLKGGVEKFKRKDLEADKFMQESTLVVTIGGAAGIAAAFRSPIGGICYMMEDMSSYWNHETTVRAFGGTLVATMVFSFLLNSMHGVNYDPLVIFDDDAEKTDWKIKDLPYFLILAVIVGVVSSFYSELLFLSQRLRRHRKNFKTPFWKTVEVFFVSLLFCSIPLYYPNLFDCHKLPTAALNCDPNDGCDGAHGVCTACCKDYLVSHSDSCAACVAEECMVDTGRRATGEAWAEKELYKLDVSPPEPTSRRLSGGPSALVQFHCDETEYNEMASLWLIGEEGAIKQLYNRSASKRNAFSIKTLFAFIAVYIVLSGCTGGLAIPFGTFVPNLFVGAALGRAFALIVQDELGVSGLSEPGTYALIGAGSMLGGYTRMTMTVVVMAIEASGDASVVVPLMLAVQAARFVATMLTDCYDEKMMELRNIPFLHDECSPMRKGDNSSEVMIKFDNLKGKEQQYKLARSIKAANAYPCAAFPVVDDNGKLKGLVNANMLDKVLSNVNALRVNRSRMSFGSITSVGEGGIEMAGMQKKEAGERRGSAIVIKDELMCVVNVEQFMDPAPYAVIENFPLARLFPLFRKLRIEHVVVINKNGEPVGVIPKTALIEADAGHVETTHNKALNMADLTRFASTIAADNQEEVEIQPGPRNRFGRTATQGGYEQGELFDDARVAEKRIKSFFSTLGFGKEAFGERDSMGGIAEFGAGVASGGRDRQSSLEVARGDRGIPGPKVTVELTTQDAAARL